MRRRTMAATAAGYWPSPRERPDSRARRRTRSASRVSRRWPAARPPRPAEAVPREPVELGDLLDAALHDARRRHPGVSFELADASGDSVVEGWPDGAVVLDDAELGGLRAIVRLPPASRPDS